MCKFEEKLHKLIKRAKKQRGMLWPSVVSKLKPVREQEREKSPSEISRFGVE